MNETELYLLHKKSSLGSHLSAGFFIHLLGLLSAGGLSFGYFWIFKPAGQLAISPQILPPDMLGKIGSLAAGQAPNLLALLILLVSGFTSCARGISFLLCVFKGLSLGCVSSLIFTGFLSDVSFGGLLFYFLSSLLFALLSVDVSIYSDCILRCYVAEEYRLAASLSQEYFLCFLTLSGGVLVAGAISSVIL